MTKSMALLAMMVNLEKTTAALIVQNSVTIPELLSKVFRLVGYLRLSRMA